MKAANLCGAMDLLADHDLHCIHGKKNRVIFF